MISTSCAFLAIFGMGFLQKRDVNQRCFDIHPRKTFLYKANVLTEIWMFEVREPGRERWNAWTVLCHSKAKARTELGPSYQERECRDQRWSDTVVVFCRKLCLLWCWLRIPCWHPTFALDGASVVGQLPKSEAKKRRKYTEHIFKSWLLSFWMEFFVISLPHPRTRNPKLLGLWGSIVVRPKLKGIDGTAPQDVEYAA